MAAIVGVYEKFVLHLRKPLPVQDDDNSNEKMVEASITKINHAQFEDSCPQAVESILEVQPTLRIPLCL